MARRLDDLPPATPLDDGFLPHKPRRPKVVGFIGWICAGLGYSSFIMKGSQLPSYLAPELLKKYVNPEWAPPKLTREQFTIAVFILFAEMFIGLICMSGGLGCLKLREWGRKLAITYGIASLVLTILKASWQIHMFDFMLDYQASVTTQPFDRDIEGNKEFLSLIISSIAQLLWPLIVITILMQRHVKDAFNAARLGDGRSAGWQSNEP